MSETLENLPYNFFAEKVILGSLLTNSKDILTVSQKLNVDAFYLTSHQVLYKAMLILYGENRKLDYVTLTTWLQDHNYFDYIEEVAQLITFFNQIFLANTLEDYINLVYEKYLRRCLIEFGKDVIKVSFITNYSVDVLFSMIQKKFLAVTEKKNKKNFFSTAEILTQVVEEIKKNLQGSVKPGLTSSFTKLDSITQGFHKGDLIILAGRPSMGKTAFALNLAKNVSWKNNSSVVFFSLEMTRQQLVYRLLSTETGINNSRLRSGLVTKKEWIVINKAVQNLSKTRIYIDDTPNIDVNDIKFKVRKLEQEYQDNFNLLIIDYLQLLEESSKVENRTQELSRITRNLKKLARELNIPIVVLSQLSRNVEARTNKRPVLSDLRESGCFGFPNKSDFLKFNSCFSCFFTLSWIKDILLKKKIKQVRCNGKKPLYKIVTFMGWFIDITGNHKFYTKKGWKRTDQLSVNDFICTKLILNSNFKSKRSLIALNWEKVVEISYKKVSLVYDLEIPLLSNFFSNRLLLHNSIEQDADVVMMLYRDEYYYPQTSEKNIVEVIVAKHRQGPLGTAKLIFDSKFLRFSTI